VRDLAEARGELPVATLPDEVLTEGPGQVRALITVAGNPALSCPDSQRMDQALSSLDFMVSVDLYRNETTRHADVILPAPSALERSHYDLAFATLAVRNVANWSPPVFPTDAPSEADVLARLALILSDAEADADPIAVHDLVIDTVLTTATGRPDSAVTGRDPAELRDLLSGETPEDRVVDAMLRLGPYGDGFGAFPEGLSLDMLQDNPHGVDLGPLTPQLPNGLRTPSGKVELAPAPVIEDLGHLVEILGDGDDDGLLLVGRRHLRSNNSWMHNVRVLVKGADRCTLQMHPDDAAPRALESGDTASVTSAAGSIDATVEVTDEIMAGVVSLPHGWGHDRPGTAMEIAEGRPGVNSNVLTDAGVVDPLSGNTALNAIPVTVTN
jgi:anaerobic selenocysteine-containing dehydrogenase